MELEIADRYPDEISGFVTDGGQPVIFKNPEYATESEVKYISSIYQDFEDAQIQVMGNWEQFFDFKFRNQNEVLISFSIIIISNFLLKIN